MKIYVNYFERARGFQCEKVYCENLRTACKVAKILRDSHKGDFAAVMYAFKVEHKVFRSYHSIGCNTKW